MDKPINLKTALASFDQVFSPRILATVNDYDVRVAHVKGDHVWHSHENTDEFFMVIEGTFSIHLRDVDGSEKPSVTLGEGDVYVVPRGVEHKPSSPGASILMFEPSGTSTTGALVEDQVPNNVDCTIGHTL